MDIPKIFTISESAHRIHNPFTAQKYATLGQVLRMAPGTRILDLGSGSGEMLCTWARDHGISGVGIDTAGSGESQQVVVSAYLLPGLQVKYGVGIFDSLATLTLRYRLMPRLYLEAVSGVNQALDLLYRFEF